MESIIFGLYSRDITSMVILIEKRVSLAIYINSTISITINVTPTKCIDQYTLTYTYSTFSYETFT